MPNTQNIKMTKPDTSLSNRPPVHCIGFTSQRGNPHEYRVGQSGVTEICEVLEDAEYARIPWVEVYSGDVLVARFNQHKLDSIFYNAPEWL